MILSLKQFAIRVRCWQLRRATGDGRRAAGDGRRAAGCGGRLISKVNMKRKLRAAIGNEKDNDTAGGDGSDK